MISIKNLSICYEEKKVLDDVSVDIKSEKITTIIGPNGCGKSTLIKAIAGIFDKSSDCIQIAGKKRCDYKRKEFSKKVAFLMQFSEIPQGMSVYDLVTFGRLPYKAKFKPLTSVDYEYIDWALKKTNAYQFKDCLVSTLSGGERQRVFLSLALAQKTEIIILDEPTNHLDMKYQYELLQLIKELNLAEKITIVCVLHDVNHALRYSDEVIVMKSGKVIVTGSPEECITKEIIHDVYDVRCTVEKIGNYHSVNIV